MGIINIKYTPLEPKLEWFMLKRKRETDNFDTRLICKCWPKILAKGQLVRQYAASDLANTHTHTHWEAANNIWSDFYALHIWQLLEQPVPKQHEFNLQHKMLA